MPSPSKVLWVPNPGPQTKFLACPAAEACFGGAAGGGKSAASIALPLRWVENPRFRCLFLRREARYLRDAIDKSEALYPHLGARRNATTNTWTFPSGAQVWLNHCEHESDVANYDSLEFALVIFEELTHFTERQYLGIKARIRGTDATLPYWVRATTNPGGEGHEWVFRRFAPWLDPACPIRAVPGALLHFLGDELALAGTPDALSRTFIPARLADNRHVTPGYRAQLLQLDPVRRAQLLDGDWLARPAAGAYFKRHWFDVVASAPVEADRCRYWDRAASPTGDWTAGVRMARARDGRCYIEHVTRLRGRPAEVGAAIRAALEDDGPDVAVVLEQDPGQAGVAEIDRYVIDLAGANVRAVRPTGSKITRAQPLSAQAEHGNIRLVRGPWLDAFVRELESFPEGEHDDQVDAASGAFAWLQTVPAPYTSSRVRSTRR
jgi:predicted phage terminase large subunit-like protein